MITTIAFDYYDGVTEGVSRSVVGFDTCYFKLLAWDEWQDQRLYFLGEAKRSDFDSILNVLSKTQRIAKSNTWLVQRNFSDDDENMVARKVTRFWSGEPSYLVLGESVHDKSLKLFEIKQDLTDRVKKSLNSKHVDDLSNWLPFLE